MVKKNYPAGKKSSDTEYWQHLTIRLGYDVHERIREIAFQCRVCSAFVIRELINEGINKYEEHIQSLQKERRIRKPPDVLRETFKEGAQIALPL